MQVLLHELQRNFRHALVSGSIDAVRPWIATADAERRLAIYRTNSRINLRNALRSDYPVVQMLVGAEFFEHAANAYIAATPSLSGDVGDFGEGFADFLVNFPAAKTLPYLSDVARLEKTWVDVFLCADAQASAPVELSKFTENSLGGAQVQLAPSVRLMASPYPVFSIWTANQANFAGDGHVDLGRGTESILLRRIGQEVELQLIGHGEFACLSALKQGCILSDAVKKALAADSLFDLAMSLRKYLADGTITTFTLGETT